ncbi:MAG: signal peptidase II [Candidatus Endonucleobacter bathymodioli]|uniref:Lipoprotein signal peptidase n=1 Tax=Candidatus Endonucleibacter bathymodioli TaxID=539814 RepID=A0AA90NNW9_9GAMM|nr:signal peptidase II [Candidatus Endonucleobacter bathymodioli]
MKNKEAGHLHWLWLSGLVWVLDQATKWLAVHGMHLYEQITVLPIFSLTLTYNTGAAFSFLSNESGWQRWFLSTVSVIVSFMLVRWLYGLKKHEVLQACAMALILGGATGNLFDRLIHGYVVDFILIHYDRFYFPAFNLADSAITIGAAMLVLDIFRGQKPCHE